MEITTDSL